VPLSAYRLHLREKVGHDLLLSPVTAALITDEAGRVLMQKRGDSGLWGLCGGAVEPHESPADSVVREVWEESGLWVEPICLLGVHSGPDWHIVHANGDESAAVCVTFACRVVGGAERPDRDETQALAWLALNDLDDWAVAPLSREILTTTRPDQSRVYFDPPTWQPPADGHRASGISDYMRRLREKVGADLLMSVGAAAIILDEQGRVLMQQRGDTGQWGIPGGALDPHETLSDAVVRETWEETGLLVEPMRVVGVYGGPDLHVIYPNGDEVSVVGTVFECRVVGGALSVDGAETLALAFFSPDEVLSRLALPERFRKRIRHVLDQADGAHFDPPTWQPPE
jgi:8-oxo-dGTP diphosphatase